MSDPGAYEVLDPADFGVERHIEVGLELLRLEFELPKESGA